MTETIHLDDSTPGVRLITINRPGQMNSFDGETLAAFNAAVNDCIAKPESIRVLAITGTGRAFCAGNDLKHMARILDDPAAFMRHQDLMQQTYESLEAAPQVVIAAVNGFALAGGFELALACDIIVADEAAELGDEHIRHNLIAGGGSSQRLPRALGLPRALYYLLTGRRMSGRVAEQLGLAALAVPADELMTATLKLAADVAKANGDALHAIKHMTRRGYELPLKDGLNLERLMQYRYRAVSPELDSGVKGFAGGKKHGVA